MTVTEEHAPGRLLDVHGEGDGGVVLLWHGRGADSRSALVGLGRTIAEHGVRVVVPDWDHADADGGRATLLGSLAYARRLAEDVGTDSERLVLVGWSLGGTAALGLVAASDEPVGRVVLLAPGDGPRAVVPFTGAPLPQTFPDGTRRPPVDLVSPAHDGISTPALVRRLQTRLAASGWSTTWTDLDADHWSIAMTRLDLEADRGVPADDETARHVGRRVAAIVVGTGQDR